MSDPVVELFSRIKQHVEEPDGSWPGAEVVEELGVWFSEHGIHPDDDPLSADGESHRKTRETTAGGIGQYDSLVTRVNGVDHVEPVRFRAWSDDGDVLIWTDEDEVSAPQVFDESALVRVLDEE